MERMLYTEGDKTVEVVLTGKVQCFQGTNQIMAYLVVMPAYRDSCGHMLVQRRWVEPDKLCPASN